jgi:transcription elongation factor Elf1
MSEQSTIKIYCPNCGAEVKIETWMDYSGVEYGTGFCENCETEIVYENRSTIDQEGRIEIVFH